MFGHLKHYRKIVVSGPQRSGTRFAAQAIAHDLYLPYVDEDEVEIDNLRKVFALMDSPDAFVLQGPGLLPYLWMLCPKKYPSVSLPEQDDVGIVVVRRPIEEIVASERRLGWWAKHHEPYELMKVGRLGGIVSQEKYAAWEAQKPWTKHWHEIDYHALAEHPLWVDKESRSEFHFRQTK